jgi:hypothetical protein
LGKFVIDQKINDNKIPDVLTKEQTIDEIIKVARELDKMDLQILLMRLRVKKMVKEKRRPVANYDSRKIKAPQWRRSMPGHTKLESNMRVNKFALHWGMPAPTK